MITQVVRETYHKLPLFGWVKPGTCGICTAYSI